MEGGANPGIGIQAVQQRDATGEEIIPRQHFRPQILTVGKENIHCHGAHLGDDNKRL